MNQPPAWTPRHVVSCGPVSWTLCGVDAGQWSSPVTAWRNVRRCVAASPSWSTDDYSAWAAFSILKPGQFELMLFLKGQGRTLASFKPSPCFKPGRWICEMKDKWVFLYWDGGYIFIWFSDIWSLKMWLHPTYSQVYMVSSIMLFFPRFGKGYLKSEK